MAFSDSELSAENFDALENSDRDPEAEVRQHLKLLFESTAASEAETRTARECPEQQMLLKFLLDSKSNLLNQSSSEEYMRKKLPYLYSSRGSNAAVSRESDPQADAINTTSSDSDKQKPESDFSAASEDTKNRTKLRSAATALHNGAASELSKKEKSTVFPKETVESQEDTGGVESPKGSPGVGSTFSLQYNPANFSLKNEQLALKPLDRNTATQKSNLLVWHRYTEIPFDISSSEFTVRTPVLPLVQGGHLAFLVSKCDQKTVNYSVKIIKKASIKKLGSVRNKHRQSLTGQMGIITKDEFLVLKKLSHPFVAKMLYFCENPSLYYYFFPRYCLVNLSSHFSLYMRLDVEVCVYVTCCIINAVEYLFRNFIVHRDISTKSVLFNSNCKPVLFHFDYATFYGTLLSSEARMTFLPELSSRAPEVISPEIFDACDPEHYVNCDIWGIGVLLGELLLNTLVMMRALKRKLDLHWVFSVREGGAENFVTARSKAPLPTDLMELLRMCLRKYPHDRPSIHSLMLNPVFGKYGITSVHNIHCKTSPLMNDFSRLLSLN